MNPTEERITELLVSQFKVARELIEAGVTFSELKFDSLVLVELSLLLANAFEVPVADDELTGEMTVAAAAELIAAKQATR